NTPVGDSDSRERYDVVEAGVPRPARLPGLHLGPEHVPRRVEVLPGDGGADEARGRRKKLLPVGRGEGHRGRCVGDLRRLVDDLRRGRLPGVPDQDPGDDEARQRPDDSHGPIEAARESDRVQTADHSVDAACLAGRYCPAPLLLEPFGTGGDDFGYQPLTSHLPSRFTRSIAKSCALTPEFRFGSSAISTSASFGYE